MFETPIFKRAKGPFVTIKTRTKMYKYTIERNFSTVLN